MARAPLLCNQDEPVVVAGDWNILRGYGEHCAEYNKRRYDTVFARAEALELVFVGPEWPFGRRADPHPCELPERADVPPQPADTRDRNTSARRRLRLKVPR